MLDMLVLAITQTASVPAAETSPDVLPQAVYLMISVAARESDDEAELGAVVSAARKAYPEHLEEIDALLLVLEQPTTEPALELSPSVVHGARPPRWDFFRDWNGQVSAAAAFTDGNTETSSFGLKARLDRAGNGRTERFQAYADAAENNGETSQQRWGASYQINTSWTDTVHGYVRSSYESDKFAGFDERIFIGAGAGTQFIDTDALAVKGDIGPGYRFSRLADSDAREDAWVLYSALDVGWLIDDDWTLQHNTGLTLSEPTTTLISVSSLSARITRAVSTGISYEFRYESNPPDDNEREDSILKFDVSYGF